MRPRLIHARSGAGLADAGVQGAFLNPTTGKLDRSDSPLVGRNGRSTPTPKPSCWSASPAWSS
jgi:hypothetical protein